LYDARPVFSADSGCRLRPISDPVGGEPALRSLTARLHWVIEAESALAAAAARIQEIRAHQPDSQAQGRPRWNRVQYRVVPSPARFTDRRGKGRC